MLTDQAAKIPVQNNRTKYRTVAAGTGRTDRMELLHIPVTEDFQVGDLMTSSGLGGTFPEGYPVGVVTEVEHTPGEAFASIQIQPLAEVNRSRVVLLVFREIKELAELNPDQQGEPESDVTDNEGSSP